MKFSFVDLVVFFGYCATIVSIALWVSRTKKGEHKNTRDYFLAGNSLPWWVIGTSLIAANISAEQLIGMTGDGYTIGLAIASYEWMAAATLIIVGKYFLPVFLNKKIYSMPQFLEIRYDERVRTIMAILWLLLYIFVNVTSILFLGGITLNEVFKIDLTHAVLFIAAFSAVYTIAGGLKAIAYTDFIQVTFLVIGGLITTYVALNEFSGGLGFLEGLGKLSMEYENKFDMILNTSSPYYDKLPGLTVLIGGLWIANLNYWGFNQYITQRGLAAKNLQEAQKGIILAGFLKILMPLIVVIPGIIAFALNSSIEKQNNVYPWLLSTFLNPEKIGFHGVVGICLAALVAAIVASLSAKTNSIATIFTMDIYKPLIGKNSTEKQLVTIGRITTAVVLVIGVIVAPLLDNFESAFQFIQEFTGFFSPGIFTIFMFGLFWKKATAKGALWVAALTIPLSFLFYLAPGLKEIPFLDRMGIIFLLLSLVMVVASLMTRRGNDPKAIEISKGLFKTNAVFNIGALIIILIIAFLYIKYW